jgi:hypothetical protein
VKGENIKKKEIKKNRTRTRTTYIGFRLVLVVMCVTEKK